MSAWRWPKKANAADRESSYAAPQAEQLSRARAALQHYWGYDAFRPGQDEVIEAVFTGRDTLVLFPTGGGKSLCYQVPALVLEGLTIVISPLVALMEDQVNQLQQRGIRATFINSTLHRGEIEQRLVNARNGMYRLLYCAPERLGTPLFQSEVAALRPALIAIDEAHCVSEWGHDFRPAYREIRQNLSGKIPEKTRWLALTATATPEVREDIMKVLEFENPAIISKGFERPNLRWWAFYGENRMGALERIIKKQPGESGLIYAGSRRACNTLAEKLQQRTGIRAAAYHAGLDAAERSRIQDAWISGEIPLVVATNAFGMGIDKANCRYVVHYDPPGSLEAYYQEAGRAGRDGELSYPMLMYKEGDITLKKEQILKEYPTLEQLRKMYDAICDTLDLAVGSEMEEPQPLPLAKVEKRSGFSPATLAAGLRVLQRMQLLETERSYERSIGIQFLIGVGSLRDMGADERYPQKKRAFLMDIFRIFGPDSINRIKYIPAGYVVERTGFPLPRIVAGLEVFQREQLLRYQAVSGDPMVRIIPARQQKPSLSRPAVEQYRNMLLKKLAHIKGYAETQECRSQYLQRYFGEQHPPACGNCDNCLSKKKEAAEPRATTQDVKTILFALQKHGAQHVHQLSKQTGLQVRKLRPQLKWMQREGLIIKKRLGDGTYFELRR
ncbi:MAG: RecQ family ATP-dependent DNA helicase [Cyclonatronaceae bacterium]